LPFPAQYVLGFDTQKKDFEHFSRPSYLRGEWRQGGWWYYYLYGLMVKVPCGVWALFAGVVVLRVGRRQRPVSLQDELVLLVPALSLFVLVSSQLSFNYHLRYIFPSLGLLIIFTGQAGIELSKRPARFKIFCILACIFHGAWSGLKVYPHHLAYFNELAGGPANGHKHLLGSSLDWGQDLLYVKRWLRCQSRPVRVDVVCGYDPGCLIGENAALQRRVSGAGRDMHGDFGDIGGARGAVLRNISAVLRRRRDAGRIEASGVASESPRDGCWLCRRELGWSVVLCESSRVDGAGQ
jgi:hypothetical protein